MSSPHVTRAIPRPSSPDDPGPLCGSCGEPLVASRPGVLWHRETGTVSCRPVAEADGGYSEPDDWTDGPCATLAVPDPIAAIVHEIEATTRQALRRFTVALLVTVALVLAVLVGIGVPLPLVAVVLGLAVLVTFAPSPRRSR